MSNDWRNRWRKSSWVTIADFPLLSLDINPATYEGGHADAGCRGDDLLKQAFSSDEERVGIKLRMRTQPGNPQHKARHLLRMACRPGEYQPDEMDREVFLQDAIAFAVCKGWDLPDWLHALLADSSHLSANELAQAKLQIAEKNAKLVEEQMRSSELAAEVERLRNELEITNAGRAQGRCVVELPHLTRSMESLFSVMRDQWTKYNPENPPKSSAVASAIDTAMGWSSQKSGEASRSAQTLASLIRPDEIADADPRNARRR